MTLENEPYIMGELGVQEDGEPVAVESAPDAAPESEEASETTVVDEEKPHKKPGSARLKEQRDQARIEAEHWKRVALERPQEATQQAAPAEDPSKPRPEQFESHDAYVEALTDWKVQKTLSTREAQTQAERMREAWISKAEVAAQKFEDFHEVLESAPAPSPAVAQALHASEIGPELAYHLATNPDLYDRLNRMNPVAVGIELGRLETRLSGAAKPEAPKPQVSKAPKPPTPVVSAAPIKPGDDGRHLLY